MANLVSPGYRRNKVFEGLSKTEERVIEFKGLNRKAVVECVQELAKRPYFHLIRGACLPWDSDRSGSISSS